MKDKLHRIAILGGGAAGFFTAINLAEKNNEARIDLFEATSKTLSKVRISGGGRCNVTHSCFDPKELVTHYPRGEKELLSPFEKFQCKDTIKWFEEHGVQLKTELDGRIFPRSDQSETIIKLFHDLVEKNKVNLRLSTKVSKIEKKENFILTLDQKNQTTEEEFDVVVIATGSKPEGHRLAESLGHGIEKPVPSLFTFNLNPHVFTGLEGVALNPVEVSLKFPKKVYKLVGPMLITHWGLSGPVILKLSSIAARELHECEYQTKFKIHFLSESPFKGHGFDPKRIKKRESEDSIREKLWENKKTIPQKLVYLHHPFDLPKRFVERIFQLSEIGEDTTWSSLSKAQIYKLIQNLTVFECAMNGKSTNKEEFVTAGGVKRKEIDFRTMESKVCKNLYFAGEVIDLDGLTGGFNFQNAWTNGWLISEALSKK